MSEAAALVSEDAVVRVLRGIFRHGDTEGRSLLHAFEDEVNAVAVASGHAAQPGQNMVFLAHALLGPCDRKAMIAGESLDPVLVISGAPAQHLLAHRRNTHDVAEEVHHLFRPRQAAEITMNDNAVEAVIDKDQQVTEQFGEQVHWPAPAMPRKSRSAGKRGPGQRMVDSASFRLAD